MSFYVVQFHVVDADRNYDVITTQRTTRNAAVRALGSIVIQAVYEQHTARSELSQSQTTTWMVTLLREAKGGLTNAGIDAIWERVEKECVPNGEENVTAIRADGIHKWVKPMPHPCG